MNDGQTRWIVSIICDTCFLPYSLTGCGDVRRALDDHFWPGWDIWNGGNGPEHHCPGCVQKRKAK